MNKEAEQKANELYIKFKRFAESDPLQTEGDVKNLNEALRYNAKQCALICVEEILNDNPNIYDSDRLNHKYWKEVKNIIKNK